MKLSEYIEKFGDKRVDVDKLSEFIIEDRVFVPKENEKYYFVDYFGEVRSWLNEKDSYDEDVMKIQQVYRTEAEAEFARDKAMFLEFMRKEFLRNSDVIDWGDEIQFKYSILYDTNKKEILKRMDWDNKAIGFYTTDEHWLRNFVEKHEDEIKKYYFEVKEN